MSMLEYVKSLLPSFGQDRIVDDLSRLRAELHELLLPSLEQAAKAFHGHKFKSKLAKGVESTLKNRFRDLSHDDLFGILLDIFKEAPGKVDALEKLVEASFAKDIVQEGITYRKASILKYIETLSFAMHFATRMSLRIIAAESNAAAGSTDEDVTVTPGERTFLDDKYQAWLDALSIIEQPSSALEGTLASIPDVIATEDSAAGMEIDMKRLDPMKLNFVSPSYNPIYHVRSYIAEHQIASISKAKEERKLVELRLHALKNNQKGQNDPKIEHQIELVSERLKKIDFRVSKHALAA